tara:strand:+ start:164 stop:487 length:324 start_codon:yes stop_codon:yes gene_type:complete
MIKEIIEFSVKFNVNLINICSIKNRNKREKETIKYQLFIDQKINKIYPLCSNDIFKDALNKYKLFIIENLIYCSFEEDIKKRVDLCNNFSEIFIENISKSLVYLDTS